MNLVKKILEIEALYNKLLCKFQNIGTVEQDPTVPDFVKNISIDQINLWNTSAIKANLSANNLSNSNIIEWRTALDLYTRLEIDSKLDIINSNIAIESNKNIEQDNRLQNIEGTNYIWNPNTRLLVITNGEGVQIAQVSLASLDNEGTDLRYNASTISLELYNGDNELLDSIPVSSFIGSVGTQLQLNSNELQLKDSQGNVLSTVNFTVDNVFQEVSATQKGIVNNSALQELGGVDKLINGVRIGCGEGNKSTNLVVGRNALAANTTGTNNIAIGDYSLWSNTTGIWNTVFGSSSMAYNTTGQYNVAVGTALYHNKTGSRNVGIGIRAGYANESGSYNTFVGDGAGYEGGVGNYNVALGRLSMIITGRGYISGGSTINRNRNVVIGTNIIVPDGVNDTLAVDNKGTTTTSYSTALLYGGFSDTNRFLNIGGKLSITPTYMPNATGDSTYTKNIVAKPDGIFGWEDRENILQNVTGNVGVGTATPTEKLDVNGNVKALKLLPNYYTYTSSFTKIEAINPTTKERALIDIPVIQNNIKKNLQLGNINYCGFAPFGSAENAAVWTVTKITVEANGTITKTVSNNITWSSVPF